MTNFDERLWAHLVAEHGADRIQTVCRTRSPRRSRPVALRAGLATVAAVVMVGVTLLLTSTSATSPAYALTPNANGTFRVTINDIGPGVPALNARLEQMGIDAAAVPVTPTCAQGNSSGLSPEVTTSLSPRLASHGPGGLLNLDPAQIPAGSHEVIAAYRSPAGRVDLTLFSTTDRIPSCLNISDVVTASPTSSSAATHP